MKTAVWHWLTVATIALVCVLSLSVSAQERHVRVGVYENSPKIFTDESGKPAGIFIDVIAAIAEREGWVLEYVHGTWPEGLDRLAAGEIDLMPDVAYSKQREALYAFHRGPVLSDWFQVYARRGNGIRSLLDLAGKRIAVLQRSVQQEAFEQALSGFDVNPTLAPFADYSNAFGAVVAGEVDAVITNRFYGVKHQREFHLEDTAIIFSPTRLFFAAPKSGRDALLAAIDEHLTDMKADPSSVYYASLRRWTSEDVGARMPAWVRVGAMVAAGILLIALTWSAVLRRQVAARTRELAARNKEIAGLYEELRRHAEDLEQRVEERTKELALTNRDLLHAKEQAESADQIKSAFLATMSHELRTPLNSNIGFTGILLQELAGPLNEEQTKQLRMVQTSSRHLLALINDVLDISKIEAGQFTLTQVSFDPRQSIETVTRAVTPSAQQKGLGLPVDLDKAIGPVVNDRRRFEQVLMNLLSNAIKFTERGEVEVTCTRTDARIVTTVRDTGIGISAEHLPRLFRPFEQIDTGLSRTHEGTGLGLSICKRLVELMGGGVAVESEPGVGSVFTCWLPADEERK